jgi:hypothetical protein
MVLDLPTEPSSALRRTPTAAAPPVIGIRARPAFGRGLLCGLFLLVLASCATAPPRVSSEHASGLVRAESSAQAERFADLVAEIQPQVVEAVPGAVDRQTEVWVQRRLRHRTGAPAPENVKGFTLIGRDHRRGRIHLRQDTEHPEWFLAHELVHALLGPEWRPLPGVLEEGLCDAVAAELNPAIAPRIRALRAIEASIYFGRMRLVLRHEDPRSPRELEVWFHYDRGPVDAPVAELLAYDTLKLKERFSRVPDALYGLGFVIATRIQERGGLEVLHGLSREAQQLGKPVIPAEWILAAADMVDPERHANAPYELIGRREFIEWLDLLPGFHADLLVQLFRPGHAHLDLETFLTTVRPRLVLGDGSELELAEVPRLRADLESRWNRPPRR